MKIFNLRLQLSLPFDYFKNLGTASGQISANKAWEIEHTYYSGSLFDVDVSWSIREDHAGFELVIGIFGYGVHFHIYDTRHWNYETKSWEVYKFQ